MQSPELLSKNDFLQGLFNALPSPTFVVDGDVKLLVWNTAAEPLLGDKPGSVYRQRGGEALHCIHAGEVEAGCGHSAVCAECIIRQSVNEAFSGKRVFRRRGMLDRETPEGVVQLPTLVTTSPFHVNGVQYALLVVEDVSELIRLRNLLPICMRCKKIRNDKDYWENVEQYIASHIIDVDFSHGLCPSCAEVTMKEYRASLDELKRNKAPEKE
ncbi:MAG TPA: PAS domain-containing protein [Dissulfurispiraceae bacterium]|nr:PAS domain-containing protein [Dissulfurispiraceae bacterium]